MGRNVGSVLFAALALISTARPAVSEGQIGTGAAILRLEVIGSGGVRQGTCFLVHAKTGDRTVVYSFLTASSLLDPEAVGERRTTALRLRLELDETTSLSATGRDLTFPTGITQGLALAVITIESPIRGLVPVPVAPVPAELGETFTVQGHGDSALMMIERVRFRSSRLVIGDRTIASAEQLIGAPAIGAEGAFGIVTECNATRVPVITLLDAAQPFLDRAIPGWQRTTTH